MAAPSQLEINNMKVWSLYKHYFKERDLYVGYGRDIVARIRPTVQKPPTSATFVALAVTKDDIAAVLFMFLSRNPRWLAYLGTKGHMTGAVNIAMTDTMARFIAWEGYLDMIK